MENLVSKAQRSRTLLVVLLLILLAAVASSPLSLQSWFKGGDSIIHLIRSNDVCYEMSLGNYYPRWLSQACFGKGLPTLNFYPPLFYLMVGFLNVAGVPIITALVALCFASFFLSGWGMYLWTRKYCGEIGAVVAAVCYLFAPYHLIDIYQRGAFPEFVALAILPFLFHGLDLSFLADRSSRGVLCTALASAAIVLTHNLTALMVFPLGLLYFLFCRRYYQAPLRDCLKACQGPLLGAGLSAFYWLPVLLEKKYLLGTGVSISGSLHYSRHFNSISGFFASSGQDVFRFNPLYGLLFTCAAVSAAALLGSRDKTRGFALVALALSSASLVLTFAVATPLYEAIPALQYLQFPYRFLGPATLFLCAFCGFVGRSRPFGNLRIAAAGCSLVVAASIFCSGELRKVEGPLPSLPPHPVPFSRNYPIFLSWSDSDFMPADSALSRGDVVQFPVLSNRAGELQLSDYRTAGSRFSCRVAAQEESDLVGLWLYFPGWKASCDNEEVPVRADRNGLVTVTVPAGVHEIRIWYGTTPVRIGGWLLSGGTLLMLLWLARGGSWTAGRKRGERLQ